ncbi:hypothetical protein [Myroides odoratimimus]|uniref:hypothetical protein n=1 Tax=Myroides odoratimimus TaxID=76832 RepID=UPI002576E724|nr:hypothetical protein [Myroides odoratimimus]MDM1512619.1 hypothetical protein [Myroides odoratimimus]
MSVSIAEIENNLEKVFVNIDKESFIYEFILALGVPLNVIEQVIDLIISEEIVNYKYDSKNQKITKG